MTAGIVGSGVIGRLLALDLARRGWRVTVFEREEAAVPHSTTYASAGMLAPYCELISREPLVCELGIASMGLWPGVLASLSAPVYFRQSGSLVVAHPKDRDELGRLRRAVGERLPRPDAMRVIAGPELATLEPELGGRFEQALYFPFEGQVDNRDFLQAAYTTSLALGVTWREHTPVASVAPHQLTTVAGETHRFDWVVDCRGLQARVDLPELRGVRGELLYVDAPEVELQRPVRLMHPRYSIYIVPRANHHYLIGATQIESEDLGLITVRSALELLSAAYTVHTGFAEARLLETVANCRPAFPDNLPRLMVQPGLARLNGMFRHGFLTAPLTTAGAADVLEGKEPHPLVRQMLQESAPA